MTEVTHSIETSQKLVYFVPDPTNWVEVSKAISMIYADLKKRGIDTNYDDLVTVESDGQSIRFVAVLPDA